MKLKRLASKSAGLTFIELVLAMAILSVLAAVALPLAEISVKRSKEIELQRALRDIREAIDAYHDDWLRAVAERKITPSVDDTGYPEELEDLVEGKEWGDLFSFKRRYLRRIPRDPFDRFDEGWGLRSYEDDPDSMVHSGSDIYDVYSLSDGIALDGTPYNTW